ncbi:MAG: HAD family phosphatase [Bacteroidales bacterium]|nr:HAD family phosphatase [Bacteroidales bacterium]
MIKAVFFDMGGVLLPLYHDRCVKAYREIAGFKDIGEYLDPCHQKGFFLDLEAGRISLDTFMEECLKHCAPGTTRETILRCHNEFFGTPKPDDVALVKELSQRYDVFLLSNNNALSMILHRPNFASAGLPLDTSFKEMFLSHEMRMLKPDPEIYLEAIRRSGHKAGECLFIDDSQKNVDGAIAVGMRAVLLPDGASLRETVVNKLQEISRLA